MKISKRRQVLAFGGLAAFAVGYSETAGRVVGKLLGKDAPKHKTAGGCPGTRVPRGSPRQSGNQSSTTN